MSSYYETTSYNSSSDSTGGATSFSALPFRKSFTFSFCIDDDMARTSSSN